VGTPKYFRSGAGSNFSDLRLSVPGLFEHGLTHAPACFRGFVLQLLFLVYAVAPVTDKKKTPGLRPPFFHEFLSANFLPVFAYPVFSPSCEGITFDTFPVATFSITSFFRLSRTPD